MVREIEMFKMIMSLQHSFSIIHIMSDDERSVQVDKVLRSHNNKQQKNYCLYGPGEFFAFDLYK